MTRKFLAIVLALLLIFGALTPAAFATEPEDGYPPPEIVEIEDAYTAEAYAEAEEPYIEAAPPYEAAQAVVPIAPVTAPVIAAWNIVAPNRQLGTYVPATSPAGSDAQLEFFAGAGNNRAFNRNANGINVQGPPPVNSETNKGLATYGGNAWWQVSEISTVGLTDIIVDWDMRSTAAGAREWRLEFSTNGGDTWLPVGNGDFEIPTANIHSFSRLLPPAAENQSSLYIRWLMRSEARVDGGTGALGGTNQINNIVISGTPIQAPISIAEARGSAIGTRVTVEGYVTGTQAASVAFMQSPGANVSTPNAGILVSLANAGIYIGQRIQVTGYVRNMFDNIRINGTNNNVTGNPENLVTRNVINSTPTPITPIPITPAQAETGFEGMLISLTSPVEFATRTAGASAQNHTLTGPAFGLRTNLSSPAALLDVTTGDLLNVHRGHMMYSSATRHIYSSAVAANDALVTTVTGIPDADRITIVADPTINTAIPATIPTIYAGTGGTRTVALTTTGIPAGSGTTFSLVDPPAGFSIASANATPTVAANGDVSVIITVAAAVLAGNHNLVLRANTTPVADSQPFTITVAAPAPPPAITSVATPQAVAYGNPLAVYLRVPVQTEGIPQGQTTFSLQSPHPGITLPWPTLPVASNGMVDVARGGLTIRVAPGVPVGEHELILAATNPASAPSQPFILTVFDPATALITNWGALHSAIAAAPRDGTPTILTLGGSFDTTPMTLGHIAVPAGANIILRSEEGQTHTITQSSSIQRHFVVNGALRLENVILSGGDTAPTAQPQGGGIRVQSGGTLTMAEGSTIKNSAPGPNSTCGSGASGGAVRVDQGASFYMHDGSSITGNLTRAGGGVYVAGSFTMQGGNISGNTANGAGVTGGGGVMISNQFPGTFNMSGGTITGNTAANQGGGVHAASGTFNMTGGTISGNIAPTGPEIHPGRSYTLTITVTATAAANVALLNAQGETVQAVRDGNVWTVTNFFPFTGTVTISAPGFNTVTRTVAVGDFDAGVFEIPVTLMRTPGNQQPPGGGQPPPPPPPPPPPGDYEFHPLFMQGDDLGNFLPAAPITRAEAAAILARIQLLDFEPGVSVLPPGMSEFDSFSDVEPDDWHFFYVAWAYDAELIRGYPDGTFAPDAPISREEFAVILARTMTLLSPGRPSFADADTISGWALQYVYTAYRGGLMIGGADNNFNPLSPITRAEAATVMNRILDRMDSREAFYAATVVYLENARVFPDVAETAWYFPSVLAATNDHRLVRDDDENIYRKYILP